MEDTLELIRKFLPDHYEIEFIARYSHIDCSSPKGLIIPSTGEPDNELWYYFYEAISKHFGVNFRHIQFEGFDGIPNGSTYNDFSIFFKQIVPADKICPCTKEKCNKSCLVNSECDLSATCSYIGIILEPDSPQGIENIEIRNSDEYFGIQDFTNPEELICSRCSYAFKEDDFMVSCWPEIPGYWGYDENHHNTFFYCKTCCIDMGCSFDK